MPIQILPYDPRWPDRFEREATRLHTALAEVLVRIEHVGSTSVLGLAAKDVIDIQLSVQSFEPEAAYRAPLECLGYVHRPDDEPAHRFFKLDDINGRRLVNIHVCESGSGWEVRHLTFRDHLRTHPDTAREYERLKYQLAPRFDEANDYAEAKGSFIQEVMRHLG